MWNYFSGNRSRKQEAPIEGAEASAISLLADADKQEHLREEEKEWDTIKEESVQDVDDGREGGVERRGNQIGNTAESGSGGGAGGGGGIGEYAGKQARMLWNRVKAVFGQGVEDEAASADYDHSLRDSASHQYQSLAELARRDQINNNRLTLQASRSSANAVLDRLSCSCFAVAVGTIVIVTVISVATVLIYTDEQKQKQTDEIVEKIQMNEAPVLVPTAAFLKQQAENINGSMVHVQSRDEGSSASNHAHAPSDDRRNAGKQKINNGEDNDDERDHDEPNDDAHENDEVEHGAENSVPRKDGVVEKEKSGADDAGGGRLVGVEIERAKEKKEEEEDADASPAEKELLHAARELNKPRKVAPGNEAKIERKILPLTPDESF